VYRPSGSLALYVAIRFHDLRHTAATILLSRAITLDIYSHVLPHMQQAASDAMHAALWQASGN
jgi:integrase